MTNRQFTDAGEGGDHRRAGQGVPVDLPRLRLSHPNFLKTAGELSPEAAKKIGEVIPVFS